MTRVAVVDLGTNSTRLLVGDVGAGQVHEIDRRLTITRLGQDVDRGRRLVPEAIARVERCLEEYAAAADTHAADRRLAFATSAVRDAHNGGELLALIEQRFGFATRLLTGSEEAMLSFAGACAGRRVERPTVVVDLGGGSTELTLGAAERVLFHASLDLGCVRLTERFLASDPPSTGEVEDLREAVRALLRERLPADLAPEHGIGVAGTATTLATLHLGLADEDPRLVHGHRVPASWLRREAAHLAATPVAVLRERAGIDPGRAPVIAAGALALAEITDALRLRELEVSETDILHGAALALAAGRMPGAGLEPARP